jgi:hypothetical protein
LGTSHGQAQNLSAGADPCQRQHQGQELGIACVQGEALVVLGAKLSLMAKQTVQRGVAANGLGVEGRWLIRSSRCIPDRDSLDRGGFSIMSAGLVPVAAFI